MEIGPTLLPPLGIFWFCDLMVAMGPLLIQRMWALYLFPSDITLLILAARQSELWSRYRFICCCMRCSASSISYVDRILKEISAWNLASSCVSSDYSFCRDEAARKLTDYVESAISEYLSVGDPQSCCHKLENMLILGLLDEHLGTKEGNSQLNFRLHPLNHLALNAYTTLASAYKMRASDFLVINSEVDGDQLEVFHLSRTSAAYSLLTAASTYHLFCFESSLITTVANFMTSAGESLLTLGRSSDWDLFEKWGLDVSNLSSPTKLKCTKCSLLDRFEANWSLNEGRNAAFEDISREFINCIRSFSYGVWCFLIQGCRYLNMLNDPLDFSWVGKSSNMMDFVVRQVGNHVDSNCLTEGSSSGFAAQGYTNQERINIRQIGFHCLLYGGVLASICYGQQSHWTHVVQSVLNYEGKPQN